MKKILTALAILCAVPLFAQVGLKGSMYFPSTGTPISLNNAWATGLIVHLPISHDYLFESRGEVIYVQHQILFPEIPSYSVESGHKLTIYPSKYKQKSFKEIVAAVGANFNFLNFDVTKAYVGADFMMGFYESEYEVDKNERTYAAMVAGFRFRLGASYYITPTIEPFIEGGYALKRYYDLADMNSFDFSIGVKFWFNDNY